MYYVYITASDEIVIEKCISLGSANGREALGIFGPSTRGNSHEAAMIINMALKDLLSLGPLYELIYMSCG